MANSSRDSNTVPSPSTPTPSSERRAIPPAFSSPLANRFSPQLTPTAKISLTDSFHHVGMNTPPPLPPSSLPSSSSSPALSSSSLLPVSTSDGKNAVGSPYQILNGSTEASTSATSLHGSQSPDITSVPMLYKQNNSRTNSPAQFNTPPGPPVFGSPLRPSAAPFSPMPTAPQPGGTAHFSEIPFTSPTRPGVLLPTSSLPTAYSNGTPEPQIDVVDNLDKAGLVAASPYVLFSAHKGFTRILIKTDGFYGIINTFFLLTSSGE